MKNRNNKIEFESDILGEYDLLNNEGKRLIMHLIDDKHSKNISYAVRHNLDYKCIVNLKKLEIPIFRTDILFENNLSFINDNTIIFTKLVSEIARYKRNLDSIEDLYKLEISICSNALVFIGKIKEIQNIRIKNIAELN